MKIPLSTTYHLSPLTYFQVRKLSVWLTRFFNTSRYPTLTSPLVSGLPILLVGSWLIAFQSTTAAQQRLPDPPRIFDELPPPSSSPIPSFNTPSSPPAFPDARPERELDFRAPNQPIPPRNTRDSALRLYRVDIFGDSPLLLSQVQRIEPEAFLRQDEGVIQAGVFADEFNAQSRVRALRAQGFQARVTTITAGGSANPRGQISDRNTRQRRLDQSYFVVIPADAEELPDIAAQVVQLGMRRSAVTQRESPRGPHVAVGPFGNRGDADRWSSYFRSVGMDARVYFGQ
jgi:hypothetical protein